MSSPKSRVETIDILRGVLACAVMFYHYVTWYKPPFPDALLGVLHTIGIYSVEAFFVVSGFSLYYSYRDDRDTLAYARNRFLRLWPVYVLAVAGCAWLTPNLSKLQIVENTTLLFGFYDATRSLVIGGWSIAVEVVLSALAPLLILFTARRLHRASVLFVVALVAMLTWEITNPYTWATHVNPVNHLAFFVSGMMLAEARLRRWQLRPVPFLVVLIGALGAAAGASLFGRTWEDVSFGPVRVVVTFATIGFVGALALYQIEHPSRAALSIGAASYSIYLLHPIFWGLLIRSYVGWWVPVVAAILTVLLSILCYRWIERPIINWGKSWRGTGKELRPR